MREKIPHDLDDVSQEVYATLGRGSRYDQQAIARALVAERLAERERCAKIAEREDKASPYDALHIARSIRNQDKP